MTTKAYIKITLRQIENAFLVDICNEDYEYKEFSYPTIEEAITKTKEVFKSDAK